ncbi:MAG: formylglycine-generating enzyme family protein, partial [Spirochaetaceae bacterium]|nr:formylglycine-generating enzyme family protein [Spirochaetaceae bacterium]
DLASTSTLQDGGVFGAGADDKPEMAFMRDILSMTVSPVAARDGLRASIIVGSKGRPGPLSIVANARSFASILAGSKSGSVWLKDLLSQKTYGDYASVAKVAKSSPPDIASAPGIVGRLSAGGQAFVLFSAGKFTLAGQAPSGSAAFYDVLMPSFGIAETEVTNAQWSRFLSENPNWSLGNKAELEKAGLVDPDYLSTWTGVSDSRPVTHISWYAASAYCEWLSKRLPPQYKAVLPSEGMWELAARAATNKSSTQGNTGVWADATRNGPEPVGSAASSPAGLSDMLGNVWEWTNDAYRPYPAFAAWRFSGSEKAVRGGSWANERDSIDVHSRGGIVAQHSSAFLGFRPAIVQRIAQRIVQR